MTINKYKTLKHENLENILHEFKFSVRWNETDTVLRLKFAQLDTLMKLTVINSDRSLARPAYNVTMTT